MIRIVHPRVVRFQRQTRIVPQHQIVVRRVIQMRVIRQVVQSRRQDQIPLPIVSR